MASAQDVTAAILDQLGPITTMKLQKLLYYCQGWHLAWEGEPLFPESIEAWANGPVVRAVYENHRGVFTLRPPWPHGSAVRLTASERESVLAVLESYGSWSARELAVQSHRERPWVEARQGLVEGDRGWAKISPDTMADYFGGLLP